MTDSQHIDGSADAISQLSTEPTTPSKKKFRDHEAWPFWKPLVLTTAAYSILAFLLGLGITYNVGGVPFLLGVCVAMILAMSQLTAIFAALGSGSYFFRLAVSQTCGVTFFFSFFGGLLLFKPSTPELGVSQVYLCVATVGSAASQFVFGLFRITRGWRFHGKETNRGQAYTLQDLFALTLFLAVVLSTVTSCRADSQVGLAYAFLAFTVFTIMFGMPTFVTTFRSSEADYGCGSQLIILVIAAFIAVMPLVSIGATIAVGPVILLLCGTSLFTWLPLAIMRDQGAIFTTRKDEKV